MPEDRARKRVKKTAAAPRYRVKHPPKSYVITEFDRGKLVRREWDPERDGDWDQKWDSDVEEKIDWPSQRANLANKATTIGPDFWGMHQAAKRKGDTNEDPDHSPEAAIHRAFQAYKLDPGHPGHWRILVEYMANALFPDHGPSRGKRPKSTELDAALLDFSRNSGGKTNSKIAQEFRNRHGRQFKNLRTGQPLSESHFRRRLGALGIK
jgi:hypothetical protein